MAVNVVFYEPAPQGGYPVGATVAYWFDENSMTILTADHPDVVSWVGAGNTIQPYQVPPPPPSNAEIDQATLNDMLASKGSVVRGLALIVLDIANGVIPIKSGPPLYTQTQLLNLIKQKMR